MFPSDKALLGLYAKQTSVAGRLPSTLNVTRFAAQLEAGCGISFDTFFNAVFESHWLKWTNVSSWRLSAEVGGCGRIKIYRKLACGLTNLLDTVEFDTASRFMNINVAPSNNPLAESRLYFEIESENSTGSIRNAEWQGQIEAARDVSLAVGFCTYNRDDYVLANIRALLSDETLCETLQRLIVVEQSETAQLEKAIAVIPEVRNKVQVVKQANYGGSGGFTRAIMEAIGEQQTTHVLLMDDDVQIEPECIARTIAFLSVAANGTAVSGQMLRLDDPTTLHESGAMLSRKTWRAVPFERGEAAEKESTLSRLSQQRHVDYGSWFYFAVSLEAVRQVGLPLPFFIVFDDVEYGLRLARHGIDTATIPGIAVWHETGQHRDARWKTYYYQRNVLVVNALYRLSPPSRAGILFIRHWLRRIFKRDIAQPMLACDALLDYLRGPNRLGDNPIPRTTSARQLCAALPHRRAKRSALITMALKVVILGCYLAVLAPRVNRDWRDGVAEMKEVSWWRRYLRIQGDD